MDQISHYINDIKTIQQEMRKLFEPEVEDEDKVFQEQPLDDDDVIDMLECMDEYINEHPKIITDPDFDEIFLQEMQILFPCCENIEEIIELFHLWFLPKRSQHHDHEEEESKEESKEECKVIQQKIAYLHSQPQHAQRTPEWYEFRNNLITASNAYKTFETSATRNQLIYEKCSAFAKVKKNEENEEKEEKENEEKEEKAPVNIETSLHWGQKYEPVSVLVYEKMSGTKVEEFGCIKHPKYDFLGASPDGIIVDPASPKYGRMLEIKNIVNREIDGIPKKEYWIQMQLQMEVCDLNDCDFLETQFIEYENEEDFINDYEIDADPETHFTQTSIGELKGIIMYFSKEGIPTYIYKPLDMNKPEFDVFENKQMEASELTWIKNIYWKLKTHSCVLVKRNRRWFQDNVSEIEDLWNIIKRERVEDFSHRAPTKRKTVMTDTSQNKCLISINGGKTTILSLSL
jgi:putative phage-type endonuclease